MLKDYRPVTAILTVLLFCGVMVWVGYGKHLEKCYRLRALDRLNKRELVVTANGFAVDETRGLVELHCERLSVLGVFFKKTYQMDNFGPEDRKQLVNAIELEFPDNKYWELSGDNELKIWDFSSKQSDWDRFVYSMKTKLDSSPEVDSSQDKSEE